MRHPLVFAVPAFAAGIAAAPFLSHPLRCGAALFSATLIIAAIVALSGIRKYRKPGAFTPPNSRYRLIFPASCIPLFLALGIISGAINIPDPLPDSASTPRLQAQVTNTTFTTDGIKCDASLIGIRGKVKLIVNADRHVEPGDIISFSNNLQSFAEKGNFRSTKHYCSTLKKRGFIGTQHVESDDLRIAGHRTRLANLLSRQRNFLSTMFEQSGLSAWSVALAQAMLLGERDGISNERQQTFAQGGIAHILAVSGLHVGLVTIFVMMLTAPLSLRFKPRVRWIASIAIIWLFALLTGMSPSVVRATIMASMLLLTLCFNRTQDPLNALAIAVLLILTFDPLSLYEPGFQLSVLATAAILIFAGRLNPFSRSRHYILHGVMSALLVTLVATLATWALTAWHFGRMPIWFLPSNVIIGLLLPLFMGSAAIYLLFLCLGINPAWLRWCNDILAEGIDRLADLAAIQSQPLYIEEPSLWLWLGALLFFSIACYTPKPIRGTLRARVRIIGACTVGVVLAAASIASLFVMQKHYGRGLIVQNIPGQVSLALYHDSNEREIVNSPGENNRIIHNGTAVTILDGTQASALTDLPIEGKHILIFGDNYEGEPAKAVRKLKPDEVVMSGAIHPSRKKRWIKEINECKDLGCTPVNISVTGPLWLFQNH